MRFLADMGISPKAVAFLQALGHDAVHLHSQGLDRLGDSDILAKAREEGRVLLTHDLGFGQLMAASDASVPSIIVFRLHDMRPGNVNHHLRIILSRHEQPLRQGAIVTATETGIRIRPLPVRSG